MNRKQHTPNSSSDTTDSSIDNAKRKTLKTIGATTAGVAATGSAGVIAGNTFSDNVHGPSAETAGINTLADSSTQHVTINIQKNRQGLEDWALIENMTEEPLVAKSFKPRYVQYDNTVLDLNALLTRQQKGKNQLELWPNHAWTHSTRGATRAPHALRPVDAQTATVNRDTRSIQIGAQIDKNGHVQLSSVN